MDASMMMSQRPSGGGGGGGNNSKPSASSSSSSSSGGGGGSSTIGKYKGVMLCNRPHRGGGPAQPGDTANKTLDSGRVQPFRAGGYNPIENDIGLSRARPERHAAPRKMVPSVTAKHKQWLANYTAEKLRMEADMEQSEEEKKKKRIEFQLKERKLRNAILSDKNGGDDDDDGEEQPQTTARTAGGTRDQELEEMLKFTEDINDTEFDAEMDKMLQEGAGDDDWGALLDGEGGGGVEFDPESDDNELVHPDTGAGGYDGDDAISRAEWRERMAVKVNPKTGEPSDAEGAVSRRDYLTSQGMDVQRINAGDARRRAAAARGAGAVGLTADALAEWNASSGGKDGGGGGAGGKDDDALSTASAVLADSKKIRSVHSARSVAAVARQQQQQAKKGGGLPEIAELHSGMGIPAPKIVTLDEDRLAYKKHTNQLPYMNRNPAV